MSDAKIETEQTPKPIAEIRSFGLLMSLVLTLILGVSVYRRGEVKGFHLILVALSSLFLLAAVLYPECLRGLERRWMEFSERLSVVMTIVIMSLTYYLMITPIALLLKILGKDLLQRKLDPDRSSYWEDIDPAGSGSRHYLPY